MGVWLFTALMAGAAALGITLSVNSPRTERPAQAVLQQEAGAQARIAFELLVAEYTTRNPAFVGTLRASDLKAAGASSASLANGSFSPEWSAFVATGAAVIFCTPVPSRAWPAMLKSGAKLESLTCVNP